MSLTVAKCSFDDVRLETLDLIIAAVGYEPRCSFIFSRLAKVLKAKPSDVGAKTLLLAFKRHADVPTRRAAESVFASYRPLSRVEVDDQDGLLVLSSAREQLARVGTQSPHVFVDYTAMSRGLYLSLIQLLRDGARFTFGYSVGHYGRLQQRYPVSCLGAQIRSVPGLEGSAFALRPRFYLFGLGYDGIGTRALADRLEPERYGVFWADPGASANAGQIAQRQNSSLIAGATVRFTRALSDVAGVYGALRLIADECAQSHKVVLCPVGPKPHILASGLASYGKEHTTLLAPHAPAGGFSDEELPLISASGEVVLTDVRIERSSGRL